MSIYSLSLPTTVTTIAAAAMDIKAAATNTPSIMEVGVNLGAATASLYGLGRAGNTPTQTAPVLLQAEDPSKPAALTGCAVAWSVAPTVPAQHLRRCSLPATIGAGVIWTFPRGLSLAVSASLVLWNITANSALTNLWVVADE